MKHTLQTTLIATVGLLLLSACGDKNKKTLISKDHIVRCATGTFVTLNKGDKVTGRDDDTEIDRRHAQDGSKKACIITGDARIN